MHLCLWSWPLLMLMLLQWPAADYLLCLPFYLLTNGRSLLTIFNWIPVKSLSLRFVYLTSARLYAVRFVSYAVELECMTYKLHGCLWWIQETRLYDSICVQNVCVLISFMHSTITYSVLLLYSYTPICCMLYVVCGYEMQTSLATNSMQWRSNTFININKLKLYSSWHWLDSQLIDDEFICRLHDFFSY